LPDPTFSFEPTTVFQTGTFVEFAQKKPTVSAVTAHKLWAHSQGGIENPTRADSARCAVLRIRIIEKVPVCNWLRTAASPVGLAHNNRGAAAVEDQTAEDAQGSER
jgi:hypothetical protein